MSLQKRREYLKSIYLKQAPSRQQFDLFSLRFIFILYDKYVFNNQISLLMNRKKLSFNFDETEFYNQRILVSRESIFYKIKKSFFEKIKSKDGISIVYNEDPLIRFFILIESFIVQLIILLQGYYNILTEDMTTNIFICQGKLYQCLSKSFFGTEALNENLKVCIEDINIFHPLKKMIDLENVTNYVNSHENKISLLKNFSNSCYLDSLLFVLLIGDDKYIKQILLNLDVSYLKYPIRKILYGENKILEEFINPTITEATDTEEKTIEYTQTLQKYIRDTFIQILNFGKTSFMCTSLRKYLVLTNPKMITKKYSYKTFTPGEIYSTLCNLFQLLIYDVPTIVGGKISHRRMSMFMMWDFINPKIDESSENYAWDSIDSNFLVFQLGVYPRLHDYVNSQIEEIEIIKYVEGVPKRYIKKQKKARVFSEYILNGKYRLFGAIRNIGNIPSNPSSYGGGHYAAYLRPFFDENMWYEYDDISPRFTRLGNEIPKDIFLDGEYKRSEMLFYTKV
jgi:hypothetical protein